MEICTHVSLQDAPLEEVIDALNYQARQKHYWAKKLDRVALSDLIRLFENCECPRQIIDQLDAWEREPVANEGKLLKWIESCSGNGGGRCQ